MHVVHVPKRFKETRHLGVGDFAAHVQKVVGNPPAHVIIVKNAHNGRAAFFGFENHGNDGGAVIPIKGGRGLVGRAGWDSRG